jgi:hypothetical protein
MIKISHRGNLFGPIPEKENSPDYIIACIKESFQCEVDLWEVEGKLFLGHDNPEYEIPISFLLEHLDYLWIHCKNLAAMDFMVNQSASFNFFWHQNDNFTLTSKHFIWTFPNYPTTKSSILVHLGKPSDAEAPLEKAGICSDFIGYY